MNISNPKSLASRFVAITALVLYCISSSIAADVFPSKPIRFIVPFGAGGPGDAIGRLVGKKMSEGLGQTVVVDNRSGATTIIGTELAAKSVPDGYTMLLISTTHTVNPSLFTKLPYDPLKDLIPVTLLMDTPFALVVHPSVQATTVAELVALAKKSPGKLNYGSSGNGSSIHLTTELLMSAANISMNHVPYKGSGPAFTDLIGGHIQLLFSSTVSALPHVKSGKLRSIAVTSAKRAPALPDLPALSETYPGFESSSWFGLMLPAKTPKPIVDRIYKEAVAAVKSPDVNQALVSQGATPGGNSQSAFSAFYLAEMKKWAGVIKKSEIKLDN